jgi:phage terminase large subunit-like protein
LKSEGKEVSHIPQGALTISEPAKAFRDTVYLGRVVHDNNPVLTWAVGNALVRTNQYNSILLYKEKNTQRIDPIAAIITAFKRAMVSQSAVPADVDLEDLFDFV